jgi:hypothetical protein
MLPIKERHGVAIKSAKRSAKSVGRARALKKAAKSKISPTANAQWTTVFSRAKEFVSSDWQTGRFLKKHLGA